jgi:BASS family bile acid:Na+ symporter
VIFSKHENSEADNEMNEVLLSISRLALLVFLVASMLEVGLTLTVRQIVGSLRNSRLVMWLLLANFVLVPLIAVGISRWFHLKEPFAIGLLLLGLAPGAPFLPKLVELSKGDLAFAVGLMALLMLGSVAYLPIMLPRLLEGANVSAWQVARPLLLMMFLPLVAGLVFNARWKRGPSRVRPILKRVGNVSLVMVLVLVIALNLPGVMQLLGTGAIAAAALFIVLSGLVGYYLGGPTLATRKVTALGTGFRNIAAALVIGQEDFPDPQVLVMLVVAALLALLLYAPVTIAWSLTSPLVQSGPIKVETKSII